MKKQKPWFGFSLALLATMTWGSLPVIAQQALEAVDAPTLVWVRFLVASLVLFVLLVMYCSRRKGEKVSG